MKTRVHTAAHVRGHALRSLVLAAGLAAIAPVRADAGPSARFGCRFVDPSGIEIAPANQDATQRLAMQRCERHAAQLAQQDAARMAQIRLDPNAVRVSRDVRNSVTAGESGQPPIP